MRVRAWLVPLAVVLLLLSAAPAFAWHHVHGAVHIGVGPAWWGAPYPYWPYYPYHPYWGPYWYWPSPVIVQHEPPVYVQQPPAPAPPPAPPAYWYYCRSAGGYYPTVPECPEPWVKVPPRAR